VSKCFLFCKSKILFGDHTKEAETRAILTQHALENVDAFMSFVPTLHIPPLPHPLAANLPHDLQAHTDFISKSLVTGDRNEELMV
jgi:hypothetical protein